MKKLEKTDITFAIILIIVLAMCTTAIVFSVNDIKRSSYLERANSLNLAMSKIGNHLNIAFETKWHKARFLSKRIERLEADSVDDLIETLYDIYMETGIDFRVIDDNGIAYYQNGMQEYWKDHRAVPPETETVILSPLQFGITNENYMKYIVPLSHPLAVGDVKIMYTVLTEPLSALRQDFATGSYGEDCLSFIIDKRGTFIYENGSGDLMAECYNFIAYIEKTVTFQYDESFEKFRDNIKNGVNNTVLVEYNGINYYMSHYNLAMENWVSIMLVPEKNTQAEGRSFVQKLLSDVAIVFTTAFVLFISGFIYMWKKSITKQTLAAEAERRSNEAKTNFLSSMSHDIRTPMNAIIGMTEIALHKRKDIPRSVQENLEKIRLSSTHMLMLINDILDIGKIESGKMSLNISEFSIVEATSTLANLIRPLAKDKGIDLRIHTYNFCQDMLIGDELRISQICINLATNAIKYTPKGGRVDIDFKQEFPPDMPDKVRIICIVRDNGIGMSKEFQKIMYDSFARATDSRVDKVEGSGLGLAICHEMVQLMNGTISCESALGEGTTFTASVILEKGKPDEIYKLPDLRILVADRDTVSTDALKRIFGRLDVASDIVNNSIALSSILEQNNKYDVAFVELGVPNNKGLKTIQKLRKHFGEDFPIVLTDIADMAEYSEQLEAAEIKLTMNKPYYYRVVYQTILSAIGSKKADITVQDDSEEKPADLINVLVAEDNDMNWEILCELLKMNGVAARRAENGKECLEMLEKAKTEEFAAVLMDIRMPVMDGKQAARLIRKSQKAWLREIPIIAMTADAFAEDIHECLDAGMDAHLSKPINLSRLISVLTNIRNKSDFKIDRKNIK